MTKEEFLDYVFGAHSSYGINELWLPEQFQEKLLEWFKSEGILSTENQATQQEFDTFKKHFAIEPGLCYDNAKKVLITSNNYIYTEGFYRVAGHDYPPVTRHGFNVKDGIKDFTSLAAGLTAEFYFGVQIPKEFVKSIINKSYKPIESFYSVRENHSVVRPYFFKCIGANDWIDKPGFYSQEK